MPRIGWVALGTVSGALLAEVLATPGWRLPVVMLVASLCACLVLGVARRSRAACLAFGAATIAIRMALGALDAAPPPPTPSAQVGGRWVAQVVTLGSTAGGRQRGVMLVRAADPGAAPPGALGPWRAYAWLPRYPPLVPGDRVAFDDPLDPVRRDGSEFASYLEGLGVGLTTRVHDLELLGDGGGAAGLAEGARRTVDEALARVVPEPMAGLASAILVGRRDRVSRELADAFAATGLSHVVAISGWNIALIGAVVGGLLGAAGLGRRQRTIAVVATLGAFTLIAGGGASVVRAALMGGVALVARDAGRPGSAATALGIAVWLLILLDPAMAMDIGFQLSVAATAGLLAWGSSLADRLRGPTPGPARRWLAESLGVSLAAQMATLPLVLFHFGRLSLVAPLANLVVAPVVAPAMLVGTVCLLAGLAVGAGAPVLLGAPFAVLGWLVLGAMVAVAGSFAALPYASVELPPAIATVAAMAVTLLVIGVAWQRRSRALGSGHAWVTEAPGGPAGSARAPGAAPARPATPAPAGPTRAPRARAVTPMVAVVTGLLTLVVGVGSLVRSVHREPRLVVTVLDVGQGDSILVEGPRGARLLLDGGPDPDRLLTVLDRHVPPWDRRIDLVILTHPHEDHVAGLAMLLGRYRVASVAENGMLGTGPGDAAFRERLADLGIAASRLAAGDRLSFDGVGAVVRWPLEGEVPARAPSDGRRINDTSVVLDLRFGERRVLLTGDIEDDVDPRLLAAGIGGHDRLDVLKVAHHGSGTATSAAWLDALRPRVALVSAGTGNPYGHPAPRTIERLESRDARVLRTDLDGDLEVSTDGKDLRIATSGGRAVATATVARDRPRALSVAQGAFLCAIPLAPAVRATLGAPAPPRPARGRASSPEERPPTSDEHDREDPLAPCYDRRDVRPLAAGGRRIAARAPTRGWDPGALAGHGGRGVIAGGRPDPRGPPGRPSGHRDRGPVA